LNRARVAFVPLVVALFAASAAQGQTVPADPAAPPDGTQSASGCPEPKMAKLPRKRKVDAPFNVKAASVAANTQWLLRIDGHDWAAGTSEANGTINYEVKMVDFGLRPRKVKVDLVLANESCDNSPWKLTRKVGYAGRYNGKLTPPQQPGQQTNQTPSTSTPVPTPAPAATTPAPKIKPFIPPPVKIKKVKPLQAPVNGRVWVTPTDVTAHSTEKPKNPRLPRAELVIDDAQSTNAIVGLGILFVVIAVAIAVGLLVLNKKDTAADVATEEGRLPTHLDTSDIGNLGISPAGAEVVRQGAVPKSLFDDAATAPVLGEETPPVEESALADEEPTEVVVPAHAEPGHIASEPGDVPVPLAGEEPQHAPLPPPVEGVPPNNIRTFLDEKGPTEADVPSVAEPHHDAATAGELAAAAAAADADIAAQAQDAQPQPAEPGAAQPAGANGASDDPFDQMVQAMLDDVGVQNELRSIVAEARDDAIRQGQPVDRDGILAELDRVTQGNDLSPHLRDKLMSRFEQIVHEELDQVPQAH
jgi:hypothetical protein